MTKARPGDQSSGAPLRRLLTLAGLVLAMVVMSACQADIDVEVTVAEDGSGVVEATLVLDAETVDAILDLDAEAGGLPVSDLVQAGWEVDQPRRGDDGSIQIVATKPFGTTSQFSEVMADLTGDDGVLRNFRLFRTKTFARVDYQLTGTIDTSDGLDSFSDTDLERALGRSLSELAETYNASEEDVTVTVEVALPGDIESELPEGVIAASATEPRATWQVSLADPDVTEVELASSTREVSALVLRGVAVVAGVLAALVAFAQLLRILMPDRRRRNRRRSERRPAAAGDRPPAETGEHDAIVVDTAATDAPTTKVVALDGLGVLYRRGDEGARALVPFARERASTMTDDDIEARARQLELGRITTGQFWASIGVDGDPGNLDADYLAQLQLTPGVVRYLRLLREREVRVACVTNDAAEWANRLKMTHSLEGLIDTWVISGSVGVRKPDPSIFEVLRRMTGEQPDVIRIVDDDLDTLDAARALGYATAWFSTEGTIEQARGHRLLRSFDAVADELADTGVNT